MINKKILKFYKCTQCGKSFMCSETDEKICDECKGIEPKEVKGVTAIGQYSRLGDNNFKGASREWYDHLRKIKKDNPNSTINVK